MRGKHSHDVAGQASRGLIPAHAGKTMRETLSRPAEWAHPRACGENHLLKPRGIQPMGSSPRMRGKHAKRSREPQAHRLIPAHAGKTVVASIVRARGPAHPRACGENLCGFRHDVSLVGSSPRMRGKPTGIRDDSNNSGLIPAHAGKTKWKSALTPMSRAHPRACGENIIEARL